MKKLVPALSLVFLLASGHALAAAYPLAERARGFLEAVDRRLLHAGAHWDDDLD